MAVYTVRLPWISSRPRWPQMWPVNIVDDGFVAATTSEPSDSLPVSTVVHHRTGKRELRWRRVLRAVMPCKRRQCVTTGLPRRYVVYIALIVHMRSGQSHSRDPAGLGTRIPAALQVREHGEFSSSINMILSTTASRPSNCLSVPDRDVAMP